MSTLDKQNKRNNGDIRSLAFRGEKEVEKRVSPDGTRKLQDEINVLTKRNCELESQLRSLEATTTSHSKELHVDSLDGTETSRYKYYMPLKRCRIVDCNIILYLQIVVGKLKEMEKTIRILKQEKEEAQKDKLDLQEKLKLQDKELKDALSQRKLAMAEYTEVSDKLSELRQQKQKLSRQVIHLLHYSLF